VALFTKREMSILSLAPRLPPTVATGLREPNVGLCVPNDLRAKVAGLTPKPDLFEKPDNFRVIVYIKNKRLKVCITFGLYNKK
jgi:hypothetical protein